MFRINNKWLLVYAFTVFAFVVFCFVTSPPPPTKPPKGKTLIDYIKDLQIKTKLLDQKLMRLENPSSPTPKKQETATTTDKEDKEKEDSIKKEIANFMKLIKRQLSSVNETFKIMTKWNEYKDRKQTLLRRFNLSQGKPNLIPHVLMDNITLDCEIEYYVIVLVNSHSSHSENRAWIRETWAASNAWSTKKNWKVIFNVGGSEDEKTINQLKTESNQYNDLLVLDIHEEPHTLSLRLLVALKWVFQKTSSKFVFKVDLPVFLHVDRLMGHLNGAWSNENYIGFVQRNERAQRTGSYAVTVEDWPWEKYDLFCKGGGFILSHSIIGKMIPYVNWVKPLKIDDAYIGHLVKLAGGQPLHAPDQFLIWNDRGEYDTKFFLSHPVSQKECAEFLMGKANIEMGKVKKEGHKYEKFNSFSEYSKTQVTVA